MPRVSFNRNVAQSSNYRPTPYYALPGPSDVTGRRFRTKDGVVMAHVIPQTLLQAPTDGVHATHFIYTFDGRMIARELRQGATYRIEQAEVDWMRRHYPGICEELPSDELDEDTIGMVLDEKKAAEALAAQAEGEAEEARKQLEQAEVNAAKERGEKQKALDEVKALQAQLRAEKARVKKADTAKAPKKDGPPALKEK
jgi:hypothetical protein